MTSLRETSPPRSRTCGKHVPPSPFARQDRRPGGFGQGQGRQGQGQDHGRRRGGGGGRWRQGRGGGGQRYQGRDLPPSKYASPRPFTPRPQGEPREELPADYEPIILPGESLAKYKDRAPQASGALRRIRRCFSFPDSSGRDASANGTSRLYGAVRRRQPSIRSEIQLRRNPHNVETNGKPKDALRRSLEAAKPGPPAAWAMPAQCRSPMRRPSRNIRRFLRSRRAPFTKAPPAGNRSPSCGTARTLR